MGRAFLTALLTSLVWAMTGSRAAGWLFGLLVVGGALAVLVAFFIRASDIGSPR